MGKKLLISSAVIIYFLNTFVQPFQLNKIKNMNSNVLFLGWRNNVTTKNRIMFGSSTIKQQSCSIHNHPFLLSINFSSPAATTHDGREKEFYKVYDDGVNQSQPSKFRPNHPPSKPINMKQDGPNDKHNAYEQSGHTKGNYFILKESEWRQTAKLHAERVYSILSPGMLHIHEQKEKTTMKINRKMKRQNNLYEGNQTNRSNDHLTLPWRALDPYNPIYNFLIEYYGIRGTKGCRRLARWSPPILSDYSISSTKKYGKTTYPQKNKVPILLQGASKSDFGNGGVLHSRGTTLQQQQINNNESEKLQDVMNGVYYNASMYFDNRIQKYDNKQKHEQALPYLWFYTILSQTYTNKNPITHCFGLHEWAMLYHPMHSSSPPPPSAKYQAHLPRRVTQQVINDAVERKGVHCTHFDAIRFFAADALPLLHSDIPENKNQGCGAECSKRNATTHRGRVELPVTRSDQSHMEQPACVHANMDLFKMALKISPFLPASLLADALELAIASRKLDVAASPYDASAYGLEPVLIETVEGRKIYKERQVELMIWGQSVRVRLLNAYEDFLGQAFGEEILKDIAKIKNKHNSL